MRSSVSLKSFEQGGEKWQADPVDWMWFDEQTPEDVYFEGITRTNRTFWLVCMTFTPLKSISTVAWRFLLENVPDRADMQMSIEDAEHYLVEDCTRITASYPPYEREARTKGVPALGSGRVFPIAEEKIGVAPKKTLKKASNAPRIALSAKPSTHQMPPSVTRLYAHALTPIRCLATHYNNNFKKAHKPPKRNSSKLLRS
ncbi:terminase large subunit domain-containing protein [Xylella fastidiosa]|uniref:terminase large subunit domain-containing protein n=1 Tax=Xylella fastidiosa TaxID=2371 RepID=UPI000A4A5326|nr:terminase family protein [Xylella fastidiosa]